MTSVLSVHNFFMSEPKFEYASFSSVVFLERYCLITFKHWEQLVIWSELTSAQQHASVSQERICPDRCMCCHSEIETADQLFICWLLNVPATG